MNEVKVVQESAGDGQNAAVYRKAKAEESGVEAITPAFGKIQFKGLDAGTYYLKETTTPDGYNKLTYLIKIEITPTYEKEKLTKYEVKYTYNDKVVVVSSDKRISLRQSRLRINPEQNFQIPEVSEQSSSQLQVLPFWQL